jgi:hypothetical protein
MVAETEARRFDDGKFRGSGERFEHKKILAQGESNILRARKKEGLEGELAKR